MEYFIALHKKGLLNLVELFQNVLTEKDFVPK